jgi:hypothetical protein
MSFTLQKFTPTPYYQRSQELTLTSLLRISINKLTVKLSLMEYGLDG